MAAPPAVLDLLTAGDRPNNKLPAGLMFKLSMMMFLQFFIWGAWFELGFAYIPSLKFEADWMNPLMFGAFNIGALVALFFSTQFADRNFAAQKFLAFSHLIGGVAIAGLFFLQAPYGVETGHSNEAKILGQGSSLTSARAVLDSGKTVQLAVVKSDEFDDETLIASPDYQDRLKSFVDATPEERTEKKLGEKLGSATKYWALFNKTLRTFEAADEETRAEKKLKDPRVKTSFVVTQAGDEFRGSALKALAPFWPFFALMLLHSIFYVPTVSITNSIAFAAFTNPEKQFGPVRLWGTIGWIVASWPFIFLLVDWAAAGQKPSNGPVQWLGNALGTGLTGRAAMDMQRYIFLVAGIASLLLAAFSLTLPHTPPKPAVKGEDSLAWLKAFKLLKNPLIAVLFVVTFIDAAVHQTFFILTPGFLGPKEDGGVVGIASNWVAPVMKIGQIAEILTMLALGWVLKTLGWRTTMIIGVLGHAARFAVFAFFPQEVPSIAVNAIHGICYAFFFATVYIYVDKKFPKDIRSSAQGLFNVLILGVGPFIGGFAISKVIDLNTVEKVVQYQKVFLYPMGAALLGAILLALFFHPKDSPSESAS